MGRHLSYTPEMGETVCEWLAEGRPLRSLCRQEGMPGYSTVRHWADSIPEFQAQYVRAREAQSHALAEECVLIADEEDDPQRARNRIDARKWFAGKLNGKYSDKATVDVNAKITGTVEYDPVDTARKLAFILAEAKAAQALTIEHQETVA